MAEQYDIQYELIPTKRLIRVLLYIILIVISLPVLIPYAWLIIGSFASEMRGVIPQGFTLSNWKFLVEPIRKPGAREAYWPNVWVLTYNTLYIAAATTALTVVLSSLGGYVISRMKFAGRGGFLALILILHAFPGIALLVALFYVIMTLGLYGNLWSVILSKTALILPLGIWIMKGFFDAVPWDIEMAALVDGLSRTSTFFKIMLPQVKPGIAALSILTFIYAWSEYILVIVFLPTAEQNWTLTLLLQQLAMQAFTGEVTVAGVTRELIMAVGLWYMLPIILFFIFSQKYLLRIAAGGVKG